MPAYRHKEFGTVVETDGELGPEWAGAGEGGAANSPEGGEGPPPKSGKGSTDAAWTDYARAHGVDVTDDMKRAEVIAACEAAGVRTE